MGSSSNPAMARFANLIGYAARSTPWPNPARHAIALTSFPTECIRALHFLDRMGPCWRRDTSPQVQN